MEIREKILSVIGKILLVIWKFYKWLFITSYQWSMLLLGLIGLLFGVSSPPPRPKNRKKIETEVPPLRTEKVLEEYAEIEPITSIEAQILEKLMNSPGKLTKEVLSEEEMKIFLVMIFRAYDLIPLH